MSLHSEHSCRRWGWGIAWLAGASVLAVAPAAADFSIDFFSPTVATPVTPHAPDDLLTSSPAVGGPFIAEDAGGPGPIVDLVAALPGFLGFELDAISWDVWGTITPFGMPLAVYFSVDRFAVGAPCSAVFREAAIDSAAADVFEAVTHLNPVLPPAAQPMPFGPPSRPPFGPGKNIWAPPVLACPPGGPAAESGGDHRLMSLIPTPPAPGPNQDDIDALDCYIVDGNLYSSLTPATGLPFPGGVAPADILVSPMAPFIIYAPAPAMGLDLNGPGTDDIDALVVFDVDGIPTQAQPGVDFALFSLRAGSVTLAMTGMTPGDVFITDFNGKFDIFAYSIELGLGPADELDALTLGFPQPPPVICADLDGDADVDSNDFNLFSQCFGGSANPPSPTCQPTVDADLDSDGDVDAIDFGIFSQCFGGSNQPIPATCPPGC